jgi:organic radical activating enzyme
MSNFPFQKSPGCRQKWAWSTIYLSKSSTASCHRVAHDKLTLETFKDFHNLPRKINDRKLMAEGTWPGGGCEYCKRIEEANGYSDRQMHMTEEYENLTPVELLTDPTALKVTPTVLEVYFNNTCNLKCIYCGPWFSSKIESEYDKHGPIFNEEEHSGIMHTFNLNKDYDEMVVKLFEWLKENHHNVKSFHILGGEPFMQDEFIKCLDFFEENPNPNLEFVIITNLSIGDTKMDYFIDRFAKLVGKRKLSALQVTASLDCWGPQQEYVRSGLNLAQWQKNFEKLLKLKWVRLQVNHAMCGLSIKTMPDLLSNMRHWSSIRPIYNNFMTVQDPTFLNPDIFGAGVFDRDFDVIESLMLDNSEHAQTAQKYMNGIRKQIENAKPNPKEILKLKFYLETLDKRRKTNYTTLFPWLVEEFRKYE